MTDIDKVSNHPFWVKLIKKRMRFFQHPDSWIHYAYEYSGTHTCNLYEHYMNEEALKAGWVNESDFEKNFQETDYRQFRE